MWCIIKRIGNLYDSISSLDNCIEAVKNTTRYKYKLNRIGSYTFTVASNPFYYGKLVHDILEDERFNPSKPDCFTIYEGIKKKKRDIQAPKLFPDQIVHWSIFQILGPYITKSLYQYFCGSIPGRGPELIKRYLTKNLAIDTTNHVPVRTWYKFCLKLDIHHFFQSINRSILISLLKDFIKDPKVLAILEKIILGIDGTIGLPIGYYTSQWLANFYLMKFDYWLKDELSKVFPHNMYMRYVDDLVIVASNKRKLIKIKDKIKEYLRDKLDLELKYDTNDQIFDISKRPIDFIGFKFTYGSTTVRNCIFHNAINSEKYANTHKYTVKSISSVLSYNGYIGIKNVRPTKHKLYSHPDKFYKIKLKECMNKCKYRKDIKDREAAANLRKSIIDMGASDYTNGIICLRFAKIENDKSVSICIKEILHVA